jgi:ketosteroid isomerase-like protein
MSENAQVVDKAYECFARGDIPALLELTSDDVQWDVPRIVPHGGSFSGRDGVGEFFSGIAANWSELEVLSDDVVANADKVLVLGRARGKLQGGDAIEYGFTHAFTVGDGQITRFRVYIALDDKIG